MKSIKEKSIFFLISILCKAVYDVLIMLCLNNNFMPGVTYGMHFNATKLFLGYIVFIYFLIVLIRFYNESFLGYSIMILFFMSILPTTSSFGLNNTDYIYMLLQILYWTLIFVFFKIFKNKVFILREKKRSLKAGNLLFIGSITFCFILVLLFCYHYNHLKISFNLADVYDVRAAAQGNLPIYISWIKASFGSVTIPFLVVYCINKKKIKMFLFLIVLDILLFSIGMDKSYLFKLSIAIAVGIVVPKTKIKLSILFSVVLLLGFCIALLEYYIMKTNFLFYLFIRRMFYVPAWMNTIYYDFFCENTKLFLSQGIFVFSKFFPKIYEENYLSILNQAYFHGFMPSPNTGLFAECFSQLGFVGLLVFPLIDILFLFFIDSFLLSFSKSCKLICSFCFVSSMINIFVMSGVFASIWITFIPFAVFAYYDRSIKVLNIKNLFFKFNMNVSR